MNVIDEEMEAKSVATNTKLGFKRCAACGVWRSEDRMMVNGTTHPTRRADAKVCTELEFCRPIAERNEAERRMRTANLEAAKDPVIQAITRAWEAEQARSLRDENYELDIDSVNKLFSVALKSVSGTR